METGSVAEVQVQLESKHCHFAQKFPLLQLSTKKMQSLYHFHMAYCSLLLNVPGIATKAEVVLFCGPSKRFEVRAYRSQSLFPAM